MLLSNQFKKADHVFSFIPLGISNEPDFVILYVFFSVLCVVFQSESFNVEQFSERCKELARNH